MIYYAGVVDDVAGVVQAQQAMHNVHIEVPRQLLPGVHPTGTRIAHAPQQLPLHVDPRNHGDRATLKVI